MGDEVKFNSGPYKGLTGTIIKEEYGKQFPYWLRYTVKLSNGEIGYIEKPEHWHLI